MRGPDDWLGVAEGPLPVAEVSAWAVQPSCGAVVVFTGTVRDRAEGRDDVVALEYEAFIERVVPRFEVIAGDARIRWPEVGRVAILHRVGQLRVGDASVVTAVSAPHREEAFAAARWIIDTVKATVPIWKKEIWADGAAWVEGVRLR